MIENGLVPCVVVFSREFPPSVDSAPDVRDGFGALVLPAYFTRPRWTIIWNPGTVDPKVSDPVEGRSPIELFEVDLCGDIVGKIGSGRSA